MVYLSTPLELKLTDKEFLSLCSKHRDLKFERNKQGDLMIMSPTGGLTGVQLRCAFGIAILI
jgi:Uma2 family endonuclease